MKKIILLCIGIMLLISLSVPTVSAKVDFEMVAQYGTPTVDGEVTDGEYSADSTYVMNAETASAWVGQVGESCVTVRFAWDEVGLYYAATINDTTPSYRGEDGHWVGIDCLELAVNPAHAIPANDKNEGIFFSFGATRRGDVVGWRHNYLDGLVSEEIMGAAQGHKKGSDGYTIEVCIPWELVLMDTDCTIGGKTDLHILHRESQGQGCDSTLRNLRYVDAVHHIVQGLNNHGNDHGQCHIHKQFAHRHNAHLIFLQSRCTHIFLLHYYL